jgi:uncharacterized protein with FMN-binding domain
MRRVSLWLLATVAVMVLLFSYRTSTGASATPTTVAVAPTTGSSSAPATSGADPDPSPSSSSGSQSSSGTYTGQSASTRWGDVQVKITVTNGKITAVDVPVYPDGNQRDAEINSYALPQLKQETLQAQSAQIDTISGATVTSDGYLQSLQSALDAAHLT